MVSTTYDWIFLYTSKANWTYDIITEFSKKLYIYIFISYYKYTITKCAYNNSVHVQTILVTKIGYVASSLSFNILNIISE